MTKLKYIFLGVILFSGCASTPRNQARVPAGTEGIVIRFESVSSFEKQSTRELENTACGKIMTQSRPTGRTVYLASVLAVPRVDDPAYQPRSAD